MSHTEAWDGVTTADFPRTAFVISLGMRLRVDGVECVIVDIDALRGIVTRPVTDAD